MKLFAGSREGSQLTDDGSGAPQTNPFAPDTWKEFGVAQQREADENRNLTTSISRQRRGFYLPVKGKFVVSTAFACAWVFLSWTLAQPWLSELAKDIGYAPAVVIIFFIALSPGFLNAHIISSVILDRPPELRFDMEYPPINLLVAAYNEGQDVAETVRGIMGQDYPGPIDIIVVDDGSTDDTISILNSFDLPNLKIIRANHGGKAKALNEGLNHIRHDIVVCIDADTFLQPEALKRIVARFLTDPPGTAAVAGCVLVKNSRDTFMTRLQECADDDEWFFPSEKTLGAGDDRRIETARPFDLEQFAAVGVFRRD